MTPVSAATPIPMDSLFTNSSPLNAPKANDTRTARWPAIPSPTAHTATISANDSSPRPGATLATTRATRNPSALP
jgi:hypothetical protein